MFFTATSVRMRPHLRFGTKALSVFESAFPQSRSFAIGRMRSEKSNSSDFAAHNSEVPSAAAFCHGLEQQILHLQEQGYVVLKGCTPRNTVSQLQVETLSYFEREVSSGLPMNEMCEIRL
eukprot:3173929-Rhodomonas_salina.5